MKRKILLMLLLLSSTLVVTVNAKTTNLNGTFTTKNGTRLDIVGTMEHDDTADTTPVLTINKTYVLMINVTVRDLGGDVEDFHDLAFTITLGSESFLGSDISYYQGYFFDSETRLVANESAVYYFDIIPAGIQIDGDSTTKDARLNVKFWGREDVSKNVDPSSDFDALAMNCKINFGNINNVETEGSIYTNKTQAAYAKEGSKIIFNTFLAIDSLDENTSKPLITSNTLYHLKFQVGVEELGGDALDFHDVTIRATLVDESFKSIIPGNEDTSYYAAGVDDRDTKLYVGDLITYNLVFYASTNVNNSDVTLDIVMEGRERVDEGLISTDPKTTFSYSFQFYINKGVSNVFDDLLSLTSELPVKYSYGLFFFFVAIPIIQRKRR